MSQVRSLLTLYFPTVFSVAECRDKKHKRRSLPQGQFSSAVGFATSWAGMGMGSIPVTLVAFSSFFPNHKQRSILVGTNFFFVFIFFTGGWTQVIRIPRGLVRVACQKTGACLRINMLNINNKNKLMSTAMVRFDTHSLLRLLFPF